MCGVGRSILPIASRLKRDAWIEKTRLPSSSISRAGAVGESDLGTLTNRSSLIEHHRFDRVVHPRIMHRRASFLCAVFRYARQTFTAWPGDWLNARSGASTPSFLHFSPGGAPGFFAPLAGLFPRTGVAPFPAFRAHVSFCSPRVRPD
jgi:hypothetical protein